MKKLISFEDFAKRTHTLKEGLEDGVEEIIPEGPLDDDPRMKPKYNMSDTEKIEEIKSFIDDADDDAIEEIVNELRDALLEMEQQGFVEEETTDELDDKHDGDWKSWIEEVIDLPDFPEEGLNNIMEIINNVREGISDFGEENDDFEDDEDFQGEDPGAPDYDDDEKDYEDYDVDDEN